jgi:DNA-binding response OmpR family regulator
MNNKVILVTQDIGLADRIQESLKEFNLEIRHVITVKEGVEMIMSGENDLYFIDTRMPAVPGLDGFFEIDGFFLIKLVRELDPGGRVVAISSKTDRRLEEKARSIGITYYLEEPFEKAELTGLLK